MKKLLVEIVIIVSISLVAGIINNSISHSRIAYMGSWPSFSDAEDDSTWDCLSCEEGDPPSLTLAEASALYQNPEILFLDARLPEEYFAGHVERAHLLPFEAEDEVFDSCWKLIEPLIDSNTLIVTYCSGAECESSLFLARYLRDDLGLDSVKVFFGGWRRWEKAGLPVIYPHGGAEG
jgi:rhodanese-related sulfurtransferase